MALADLSEFESLGQVASTTTDSLGNIFNAQGQHIGVVSGSQADIGTSGIPVSSDSPYYNDGGVAIANQATGGAVASTSSTSSRGLEDYLVIIVGLILVSAGVFAFDKTQQVISSGFKTASKVTKVASVVAS